MVDKGGELVEIQQELRSVKKALQGGGGYLGMQGENLQRYLLQLNEKENLFLSQQLQSLSIHGNGGLSTDFASPAREAPPGAPKNFTREDLPAVLQHMCEYEAVPQEGAKALRALSSLAYADAAKVGGNEQVLQQLLRLLALHPDDAAVQCNGMRALCNVSYDQALSLKKLSGPAVFGALLAAAAKSPDAKDKVGTEAVSRAGEAVARILAAETCPDGIDPSAPRAASTLPDSESPLARFFLAACGGDPSWQGCVPRLLTQMVANEVAVVGAIGQRFVNLSATAAEQGVARGWLSLARHLAAAEDCNNLGQVMVDLGAIRVAVGLMEQFAQDSLTQLAGVEALSSLVGNRYTGLTAFAESGGMQRIEAAMALHTKDVVLQTKSIRAMASGVAWTPDVQRKASYNAPRAVELTKTAMVQHGGSVELLQAALEALSKYLDKLKCTHEVRENDGEGQIKVTMTRHAGEKSIQQWGRIVLDGIGVDKSWKPAQA